jgi:DNA-binding Lrp family transcriptional regulator
MIQDVIEEIKKVNKMIDFYSTNNESDFMLKQYQSKRDQLISELEEELVKLNDFYNWKDWKNSVYL